MRFLSAKMETFKDSELSGLGWGDCVYYWFTGTEEVHMNEGKRPLRHTLRK